MTYKLEYYYKIRKVIIVIIIIHTINMCEFMFYDKINNCTQVLYR